MRSLPTLSFYLPNLVKIGYYGHFSFLIAICRPDCTYCIRTVVIEFVWYHFFVPFFPFCIVDHIDGVLVIISMMKGDYYIILWYNLLFLYICIYTYDHFWYFYICFIPLNYQYSTSLPADVKQWYIQRGSIASRWTWIEFQKLRLEQRLQHYTKLLNKFEETYPVEEYHPSRFDLSGKKRININSINHENSD